MKIYIWQQYLEFSWPHAQMLTNQMKENSITWLCPVFTDEEKAKEFCWDRYLEMRMD